MSKISDRAYQIVRGKILDGTIRPGSQITEDDIAVLCGVSRTPVREAMQRLLADMFLERSDSQRWSVSKWSNESIEDLFAVRAMLESHVADRAARAMTDEMLTRLKATSSAIREAIALPVPDVDGFLRENAEFHRLILDAAGSELLVTMMRRLMLVPIVHQTAQRYSRRRLEQSLADHDDLISAFEAHDASLASAIMTLHIRRARLAYFGPPIQ
jgi:DNA-binding GntR family transcriptional regulator